MQNREARRAARDILHSVESLLSAYSRVKELNPEWDDEIRGAARLEAAIAGLDDCTTGLRVNALEMEAAEKHAGLAVILATRPAPKTPGKQRPDFDLFPKWMTCPRPDAVLEEA